MEGKRLIKKLSEENNELKQYIETLNKECMELQAALFEEANKMAQTAYAAEYAANKRADECGLENAVLKQEVQALKNALRLHIEENSNVFAAPKSMSTITTPEIEDKTRRGSLRRLGFLRNSIGSTPFSATLPPPSANGGFHSGDRRRYSSTISNSSNTTSVINVTSHEPVTRRRLLEALTSSVVCAETVAEEQFQEIKCLLSPKTKFKLGNYESEPGMQGKIPKLHGLIFHDPALVPKIHLRTSNTRTGVTFTRDVLSFPSNLYQSMYRMLDVSSRSLPGKKIECCHPSFPPPPPPTHSLAELNQCGWSILMDLEPAASDIAEFEIAYQ
ncbi:hypothetical protein ACTXT7_011531 [Hymenolepis weldensis]